MGSPRRKRLTVQAPWGCKKVAQIGPWGPSWPCLGFGVGRNDPQTARQPDSPERPPDRGSRTGARGLPTEVGLRLEVAACSYSTGGGDDDLTVDFQPG